MRRFALPIAFALLSGCAGISKEECLYADWNAVGYEDGAAGRPVSAISPRRAACAKKARMTVDMAAYRAGREEGLEVYCQPSNGYAAGANGAGYYGVCPGPREAEFMSAYEAGRHLYLLERAVAGYAADIRQAHFDLRDIEHRIAHTQTALIAPDTPHAERLELLAKLMQLSEDRGKVETALIALNRDHARAEDELAAFREFIAVNGPYPSAATRPAAVSY